jgi:hypothetical protein
MREAVAARVVLERLGDARDVRLGVQQDADRADALGHRAEAWLAGRQRRQPQHDEPAGRHAPGPGRLEREQRRPLRRHDEPLQRLRRP